MEKKFTHKDRHWGANRQDVDNINNRDKTFETLQLIIRRHKITEPGNFGFKVNSHLNQEMWIPRQPDKRGRDEVAAVDLELVFKKMKRINGVEATFSSSSLERIKIEPEKVSSTVENDVVKPSTKFPNVDLKDCG